MSRDSLNKMLLPREVIDILENTSAEITIPESRQELFDLAMGGKENETFDISYDVKGKGMVREAQVIKCKNGIVCNYEDTYMRRRDPDCMFIADSLPTDKIRHEERFGVKFDGIRRATYEWIKALDEMIIMPFYSGNESLGLGYPSLLICPKNAAFFAASMADLQGFVPKSKIPNFFKPRAVIYVAPPFRHTDYEGKQVVVHNRLYEMHEIFSYNLYPGPSAKKGIYGVLLNIGEQEGWTTLHASTVSIVTPYEMTTTIMHEGASGGGKSEMIEPFHREDDGSLLLGVNTVTNEEVRVHIYDHCKFNPVTDDMAIAHTSLQNHSGKLVVADAENSWFLRVNHITEYGTEPSTEKATINPKEPLCFLNMEAVPGSTCLIWEPVMDEPGKPCPNPRAILPRRHVENHLEGAVEVDIRSFGIRTPPTSKDNPNYGIVGMFHVLPPALGWLWRLVAPRGYANPSILEVSKGMKSEGVGSYWPFATGRKVDQANILLEQILNTPNTKYVLIPNQYIGVYKVNFAAQWTAREYLSRRGGTKFRPEVLIESRCPILGYALKEIKIDGERIPRALLQVNYQPEVGEEAYDIGAKMLTDFFMTEAESYLDDDILPLGRQIIKACLRNASVQDYYDLIPVL